MKIQKILQNVKAKMQMKIVKEKQMTSQFERQLKKKKNYMKKKRKILFSRKTQE